MYSHAPELLADPVQNPQSEHERYIATHVIPDLHGADPTARSAADGAERRHDPDLKPVDGLPGRAPRAKAREPRWEPHG